MAKKSVVTKKRNVKVGAMGQLHVHSSFNNWTVVVVLPEPLGPATTQRVGFLFSINSDIPRRPPWFNLTSHRPQSPVLLLIGSFTWFTGCSSNFLHQCEQHLISRFVLRCQLVFFYFIRHCKNGLCSWWQNYKIIMIYINRFVD